jgi:hypothetical protein
LWLRERLINFRWIICHRIKFVHIFGTSLTLHHSSPSNFIPMKRVIIATLSGLLFGFVCYLFASSAGSLPMAVALQIIISRTLIGFAIGISNLKLGHWAVHGIVMGLLFSLPLGFGGMMAPENPEFTKEMMFASTVVMGVIYGLLIELITSVIFKAKQ